MTRTRSAPGLLALGVLLASATSCSSTVRTGSAPVYLVIQQLVGAQGNHSSVTAGVLNSDVLTLVTAPAPCTTTNPCPTVFDDAGQVTLALALKDLGNPASPASPTSNNAVTINRIHVEYVRADGRNTPGVDVPYPFDGAATGTVPPTGTLTLGFELVRHIAKSESPLAQLVTGGGVLTTIANVTFYGQDQVGNVVSVTGSIQINFANFGDT